GELLLEDREKTPRCRDAVGAVLHELFRRLEKRRAESPALLVDHHARACTGYDLVEHRERPRIRVARVTGRPRPLGVEHEDAHARAVNGFRADALDAHQKPLRVNAMQEGSRDYKTRAPIIRWRRKRFAKVR